MQAAEHGANFPMAKKVQSSMTHDQMYDFSVGSEDGKPEHVFKPSTPGAMGLNKKTFKARGQSEADATKSAIQLASKSNSKGRHSNLGTYLHPKKNK